MPYRSVNDLPRSQVDQYGPHQQEVFLAAFNHALEEYGGDEHRAFAVAHAAAQRAGGHGDSGRHGGAAEDRGKHG